MKKGWGGGGGAPPPKSIKKGGAVLRPPHPFFVLPATNTLTHAGRSRVTVTIPGGYFRASVATRTLSEAPLAAEATSTN
jgi:hypothetical protein